MADPIEKPTPVAKPGPGLHPSTGNAGSHQDAALDDALEKVMANARAEVPPEVPLKRRWDAELEAEMEAALTGFDPTTFDVARERSKTTDRAQGAGRDRGQEARKGTSIGTVICVRGRSLFVDLGGKSEGVIPLDQFEGEIPAPGRRSSSSSITSTPARESSICGSRGPQSRRAGRTCAKGSSSRPAAPR